MLKKIYECELGGRQRKRYWRDRSEWQSNALVLTMIDTRISILQLVIRGRTPQQCEGTQWALTHAVNE